MSEKCYDLLVDYQFYQPSRNIVRNTCEMFSTRKAEEGVHFQVNVSDINLRKFLDQIDHVTKGHYCLIIEEGQIPPVKPTKLEKQILQEDKCRKRKENKRGFKLLLKAALKW